MVVSVENICRKTMLESTFNNKRVFYNLSLSKITEKMIYLLQYGSVANYVQHWLSLILWNQSCTQPQIRAQREWWQNLQVFYIFTFVSRWPLILCPGLLGRWRYGGKCGNGAGNLHYWGKIADVIMSWSSWHSGVMKPYYTWHWMPLLVSSEHKLKTLGLVLCNTLTILCICLMGYSAVVMADHYI